MKYLDNNGLIYFWNKIKSKFALQSDLQVLISRIEALENNKPSSILINGKNISYTATENETYNFYFADSTGNKLEDYEPICSFTLNQGDSVTYSDLNTLNIAPLNASKIIAVKSSNNEKVDEVTISGQLVTNSYNKGNKLYSFGLLSDIHIDGDGSDSSLSISDFTKELQFFNAKSTDFIAITGDLTYDGRVEDFTKYKELVDTYAGGKTILACRGNHDSYTSISNWNTYVNSNGLNYEYTFGNDKFLIVGLNAEDFSGEFITQSQLDWLIEKLNLYRNQRVFLLFHVFVSPVGNVNNLYPYMESLSGTIGDKFIEVINHFKNVVFLSGHSHLSYRLQKYSEYANIQQSGTMCHRIHTPSGSKPRQNDSGTSSTDTYTYNQGCEGAIVEVYENGIILKGRDFEIDKYLPIASYYLPTTLVNVEEFSTTSGSGGNSGNSNVIVPALEMGSISRTDGSLSDSTTSVRTVDFIPVNSGDVYIIENVNPKSEPTMVVFYDSNQTIVTGWNGTYNYGYFDSGRTVEVPSNASFMKLRCNVTDLSTITITLTKQ